MAQIEPIRFESESPEMFAGAVRQSIHAFDLRDLLRILWRRKGVIIGTAVIVTALALLVVLQLAPKYTAVTDVLIDPRVAQVVNVEAVLSGLTGDIETIESEIEVFNSRGLATKAVAELKLKEDPEFNKRLRRPGALISIIPDFVLSMISKSSVDDKLSSEDIEQREEKRIVDKFLTGLKVRQVGFSRVIRVSYESENPKTAAAAANTLSEFYIVAQLDAKFEATKRASRWLGERIADLRNQVASADGAVETYRANSGLLRGRDVRLSTEEVSSVNSRLVQVRAEREATEAQLQQVEVQLKSKAGMNMAGDTVRSEHFQALRQRLADAERLVAELWVEYGEQHPKMIKARAELADLNRKLKVETGDMIRRLRDAVATARIREKALQATLKRLKTEIAGLNNAEIGLHGLEREAQANRKLLETFLERFKETQSQENFQQADATILSPAPIPEVPSFPNKRLMLVVAFIGAVALGLVLAFTIERLDSGFRSMEQIEQMTGLPALGLIPELKRGRNAGGAPEAYILENPTSAYGEAVRRLHTGLVLSNVDSPPKVVLITSALPGEGKTSVAISLARMLANSGQKVVIIDCDLRRPTVHKLLDVSSSPGLAEYLAGGVPLEQVIQTDSRSKVRLIAAGAPAPHPVNLLGSDQMKKLLSTLAGTWDIVIIDSAPVTAVSDTLVLSRLVDQAVYLVRWAGTDRQRAIGGLKQLLNAGINVVGVALTMVDVRKHAGYGYADSGYYHGRSRKYYTD